MGKSRIYTKTGDEGFTSLVGGKRVLKTHPRIEAYGTIDELNASMACLSETIGDCDDREILLRIQSDLFTLGAYLASEKAGASCAISEEEIAWLEEIMDQIDEQLPPLKHFILPGGCAGNAWANVCRTVCRRAERCIYRVNEQEKVDPAVLRFVNRLSDFFFLFGRKQSDLHHTQEIIWEKRCK